METVADNVGGISKRTTETLPTTSLVGESRIFGRGRDEETIVQWLLGDDEVRNDEFSVIAIVGMGGLGKTTLAQLAYNHDDVNACFELKTWVWVSEDFDITRITKTILQSFTSENCDSKDLNWLQERLKEKLLRRKFLIVLDDVWNENEFEWALLCKPFRSGVPGCKLLVTTRNEGVVSTTRSLSTSQTVSAYRLQELSDEECLSLLEKRAMGTRSFDEFPNLKEIGMEIVRKCKGLPLAIKTMGGLLRTKYSSSEWEGVLNAEHIIDINPNYVNHATLQRKDGWSRKVNLEWIFLTTNFVVELLSAVFDQLSSVHKPQYALISMLMSCIAMLVCIAELLHKGRKERVARRCTFIDIFGLACAISQFIVSAITYSFAHRNANNPIKISVLPIIFAFGLLCSKFLRGRT